MASPTSISSPAADLAITGYACRLPGAPDAAAFWRLMMNGQSAIRAIPGDRFDTGRFFHPGHTVAGKIYVKSAGLLEHIFDFDAGFFGISPREAAQMDPQQRILLQVTWEAIEHAKLTQEEIEGPRTGVFVGASSCDHMVAAFESPEAMGPNFMTGNTMSILANRLAYHFDIKGPSSTIDTACSSSLFALHQAALAIRAGEIDRALVAGVNILLSPYPFVGFSRAAMLSPDGECRAFDASANGYVRGEGAVVMVLERADLAPATTRSRLAGIGVNSDGSKAGLSLPSGEGQADLLERVWRRIDHSPDEIAFVEAHGTGTPVGDPIEATALGRTIAKGRASQLPIGSAKTNVGHLEAGSGMVGLLKAQMALEHGLLPPSRNFHEPNPDIDFEALNLKVAAEATELPARGEIFAGVNSFGFGGTNGHAVLQRVEPGPAEVISPDRPGALILTAASADSLAALAGRWAGRLAEASPREEAELLSTAAHRRTRHRQRLLLTANGDDLVHALSEIAAGADHPALATGTAPDAQGGTAFVFCGNGAQWAGMGLAFYAEERAFRASFDRVAEAFEELGLAGLATLLQAPNLGDQLEDGLVAQPLLFAVQVGLVEALAARGLAPSATAGHSVGEVAAAWAAGCLDLPQACKLITARATAMTELQGSGGMAAVLAGADDTRQALSEAGFEDLEVAGDNSPRSTTISGPAERIAAFAKVARKRRLAVQRLPVAYPYHSEAMEQIERRMRELLGDVASQDGRMPFFSATLGRKVSGAELTAEYWWQNARQAVLFRDAVEGLCEAGMSSFVEIGPRPLLQNYVSDTAKALGKRVAVTASLDRDGRAPSSIDQILARALANGASVDTDQFFGPQLPSRRDLPAYPWDQKTLRHERAAGHVDLLGHEPAHPLLGHRVTRDSWIWQSELDLGRHPWLSDHRVAGTAILPATAFLEIALAATQARHQGAVEIRDLDLIQPLVLDDAGEGTTRIRTTLEPETGLFRIESRPLTSSGDWILHARGVGAPAAPPTGEDPIAGLAFLPEWRADDLYRALGEIGLDYGDAFRRVTRVSAGSGRGTAYLSPGAPRGGVLLDPALADAGLHGLYPLLAGEVVGTEKLGALVPTRFGRVRLYQSGAQPVRADLSLVSASRLGATTRVRLIASDGAPIAEIEDLRLTPVDRQGARDEPLPLWHEIQIPIAGPLHQPKILEDPEAVLAELELSQVERSEIDLLIDAAARRIASEGLEGGKLSPEIAEPLSRLVNGGSYPELQDLIEAMLALEPKTSSEMLAILRQRQQLLVQHAKRSMPTGRRAAALLWPKVLRILEGAIAEWPASAPCRILLIGDVPLGLPRALLAHRPGLDLALAGGNADLDAQLLARFEDQPEICLADLAGQLIGAPFDLVVVCDAASALLAASSTVKSRLLEQTRGLVIAEAEPNAFDEVNRILNGEVGQRASIQEINRWLSEAGARTAPVCAGAGEMQLVVASFDPPAPERDARVIEMLGAHDQLQTALVGAGFSVKASNAHGQTEACPLAVLPLVGTRDDALAALRGLLPHLAQFDQIWCALDLAAPEDVAWVKGYLRVLGNEAATVLRVADLRGDGAIAALVAAIADDCSEGEISLHADVGSAARVVQVHQSQGSPEETLRLDVGRPGLLDTAAWMPVARRLPAIDEVEIEVSATGLNFRDVMWAQRLLPAEALEAGFAGAGLGMECAGRIVRAGEQSGFAVGERVLACAPHAFSRHVTVAANAAVRVPEALDLDLAAGLPVAFLTAHFALVEQARIAPGDTVLIHGAAGGVGQAAIQVAKAAGARILCTAGTPEKRDYLKMLGVDGVFDSRNLAFVAQIEQVTDQEGVDIVLNCLAGDAMEASLRLMKPFGRFVELGKQDLYTNRHVGLRPLRNNVSYFAIDLDQMMAARRDQMRGLLEEILKRFEDGVYAPIPMQVFSPDRVVDALRLMQGAGHLGKIVIQAPEAERQQTLASPEFSGAWLVTGGFSGLGLAAAEWLADKGAGPIWLASRSGAAHDREAQKRVQRLAKRTDLRQVAVDIGDPAAVEALFEEMAQCDAPLCGILHAAMVLDDDRIAELDPERLARVAHPKLAGTRLLDQASRALAPKHFIAFSSIATLIGNPGQAAYAAANAAMEAIIRARAAQGLPALALGLGAVSDQGHVAADDRLKAHLDRQLGGSLISTAEVLKTLETLLARPPSAPVIYASPMPWGLLAGSLASIASPRFERVDRRRPAGLAQAGREMTDFADLDDAAARAKILSALTEETARILRMPVGEVDAYRAMADLGFDSLMAVDLKLAAEEHLGISMPVMALGDQITLAELTGKILERVRAAQNTPRTEGVVDDLVSQHVVEREDAADQDWATPHRLRGASA